MKELIVDPEFQALIPALTAQEFAQLRQNVLAECECHDPIIVWQDHDIILDGHNRWSIIQSEENIGYSIKELPFESREDAIAWICSNQLGRRNLTEAQKDILYGRALEAAKIILSRKQRDSEGKFIQSHDESKSAYDQVAEDFGIKPRYAKDAGRFVRGLDEVEKEYPGTIERVKSGDLEVVKRDVMAVTALSGAEKEEAIKTIASGKRIKPTMPDSAPSEPYNFDDYRSELFRKADMLDKSLELTCVLAHKEMLEEEEGKEILRDALLRITEVVKKYLAMC